MAGTRLNALGIMFYFYTCRRMEVTMLETCNTDISEEIQRLRKERNAIIVAHNYQNDEIQDIADVVGDSFYLSKFCSASEAQVIVFCGVRFMAESAKILSPQKTVLLPESQAGCPLADSINADDVRRLKAENPGAVTVCYINSSAEVKAESDICCTSSNAVRVVSSVPEKDVIFIPDKNLGSFVQKHVPDKNLILFDGCCVTHNRFGLKELEAARAQYPEAPVAVHPECSPEIVKAADFVGSTSQIIDYCKKTDATRFIIGTEMGVLHKLRADSPEKQFYLLTPRLVCSNMKLTTLNSVYRALNEMRTQIQVGEEIRLKAITCLERMLRF
jgi:quinolinate synthase